MQKTEFSDFEAFQEFNPQVDSRWLVTKALEYRWTAESLSAGDCQLLRCHSSSGLIIEGTESLDCYQFYVPFPDNHWRDHGSEFGIDHVLLLEPGSEQCETCSLQGGWHGFFIPAQLVSLEPGHQRDPARSSYIMGNQRHRADAMRNIFQRYITAVTEHPALEFSPAARMVEAELRMLLEPLLSSPDNPNSMNNRQAQGPGRPGISRRDLVEQAQSFIETNSDRPLRVLELATQLGVSERTLLKVFKNHYQLGVSKYFQIRQLHQVRRELLNSNPEEATVTGVLSRRGIWEFGRFSGRYKQQFGELPSQTLKSLR